MSFYVSPEMRQKIQSGIVRVREHHDGRWLPERLADRHILQSAKPLNPHRGMPTDYDALLQLAGSIGFTLETDMP